MSESAGGGSSPYVHATAFVVCEIGVLVRGASGTGKSRLALLVIAEAQRQGLFGRLVGDDRIALAASGGRLVARGHPDIAGLAEQRGSGIVAVPHEHACVVRIVVDVEPEEPPRMPSAGELRCTLLGVAVPRLILRAGLVGANGAELLARLATVVAP